MSNWRPSSPASAARRRANMLDRARRYFLAANVLAVDTPALSRFAVSDPHIDSLAVLSAAGRRCFLHTSPEFHMKRLLAAGYPDIYSICRVFRDGEAGSKHLPEFTMIEWYRLDLELAGIVADAVALIAACLDDSTLANSAVSVDYADAFTDYAGIDVLTASADDLAHGVNADRDLRTALGTDRDAWLDLILSNAVIPRFSAGRLTVLQRFPASKAALARLCPEDQRFADRFEIFFGSMELANGYVELTDANEQRLRIDRDLQRRRNLQRSVEPWDKNFLQAMDNGLPACAGVAVGVERLQMILDGADHIRDVVTFASDTEDDNG